MQINALDALFEKPDYSGVARSCRCVIDLTAEESAAILLAYDRGLDALDDTARHQLDQVIASLKDQIWP